MADAVETNVRRLLELADLLRSSPEVFCMRAWKMCVCGWATRVHPDLWLRRIPCGVYVQHKDDPSQTGIDAFAKAFGLDYEVAEKLTAANAPHQTRKAAAEAVEQVAKDLARRHETEKGNAEEPQNWF